MEFETYRLSDAACEYMQEGLKYFQGGDVFFIPIIRAENNAQTVYDAVEFPPEYKELEKKLHLYCVCQYKNLPKDPAKREKERLCIVIPRVLPPQFSLRNPRHPQQSQTPLRMKWLDEAE